MTAPALPGAAPDPTRLPPEVDWPSLIQRVSDSATEYGMAEDGTEAERSALDRLVDSKTALYTAIARAFGGDGEPVAWAVVSEPIGLFSIIFDEGTTQIRYGGEPEAHKTAAQLNADKMRGHPFRVVPLFTRPAATGDTGEGGARG